MNHSIRAFLISLYLLLAGSLLITACQPAGLALNLTDMPAFSTQTLTASLDSTATQPLPTLPATPRPSATFLPTQMETPLVGPIPSRTPGPSPTAIPVITTPGVCVLPSGRNQEYLDILRIGENDCLVWIDEYQTETGFRLVLQFDNSGGIFIYDVPPDTTAMPLPPELSAPLDQSREYCIHRKDYSLNLYALLPDREPLLVNGMAFNGECRLPELPTATPSALPLLTTETALRLDSWSPDSQWIAYWAYAAEDLAAIPIQDGRLPGEPPGRLRFVNIHTRQTCTYPDMIEPKDHHILWDADHRVTVFSQGKAMLGKPCEPFSVHPQQPTPQFPDESLSPDKHFQAKTLRLPAADDLWYFTTSLIDTQNGQVILQVDWSLFPGEGFIDQILGGEWITDTLFLINTSADQGPLLLSTDGTLTRVAPDLFGLPGVIDSRIDSFVGTIARGKKVEQGGHYHLMLGGIYAEAGFPTVRLYHSETGQAEELPFRHIGSFSDYGQWIALDERPTINYEASRYWIRPVDPVNADFQPFGQDYPYFSWSPDGRHVALLNTMSEAWKVTIKTLPELDSIGEWENLNLHPLSVQWSPDGRTLAIPIFTPQFWYAKELNLLNLPDR